MVKINILKDAVKNEFQGAKHIPLDRLEMHLDELNKMKDRSITFYPDFSVIYPPPLFLAGVLIYVN